MNEAQFLFFRGSTPTLELALPLAVDWSDSLYLTLCQRGEKVLEYAMNGVPSPAAQGTLTRDEAQENLLLLTMTQADTLALDSGEVELQLRIRTQDGADTFRPLLGQVGPARKEGVIQ
ncbi:MAG: hypothetical protein IKS05_09705 [Oscillospiraceae bacterium]|nr:hypothetical protein [Oscillospiraceae bacterium]